MQLNGCFSETGKVLLVLASHWAYFRYYFWLFTWGLLLTELRKLYEVPEIRPNLVARGQRNAR